MGSDPQSDLSCQEEPTTRVVKVERPSPATEPWTMTFRTVATTLCRTKPPENAWATVARRTASQTISEESRRGPMTLRLSSQLWFHTQTIHVLQDRRTASMFYFKLGEFFSYCHVVALLHQAIVTLIASGKVTSEIAQRNSTKRNHRVCCLRALANGSGCCGACPK